MTTAGTPARSEAARILAQLQLAGMKRAEIARQIGVSAETLKNISRGHTTGDTQLALLRNLQKFAPVRGGVTVSSAPTSTLAVTDTPGDTSNAPTASDAPAAAPDATQAMMPTLDAVDAPRDERSTGAKLRDSIKDAILGRSSSPTVSAPASNRKGGSSRANEELVEQLVPTLALLVVVFSHAVTPERYAAVAPQHGEAAAMLTPLVRVMTRQMDAAGKLTETQMDLLQCLLAMGLYGQRAYATYRDIRAKEALHDGTHTDSREQQQQRRADRGDRAPAPAAAESSRAGAAPQFGPPPAAVAAREQPAASRNGAAGRDAGNVADPFAAVYAADALGRRQLGIN